jgi:hypothetical protein
MHEAAVADEDLRRLDQAFPHVADKRQQPAHEKEVRE